MVNSIIKYNKALHLAKSGLFQRALVAIDHAILIEEKPEYLLAKGKILANIKQYKEAIKTFQKIPANSEEWEDSKTPLNLAKKLSNPFSRVIIEIFRSQKITAFINVLLFIGFTVFLVLFINEREINTSQKNLISISEKTQLIFNEINHLNKILRSDEILKPDYIDKANNKLLDSLESHFLDIDRLIKYYNKKADKNELKFKKQLDSLDSKLNKYILLIEKRSISNQDE